MGRKAVSFHFPSSNRPRGILGISIFGRIFNEKLTSATKCFPGATIGACERLVQTPVPLSTFELESVVDGQIEEK